MVPETKKLARRQLKKTVMSILDSDDQVAVFSHIMQFDGQAVLNPLFIGLCHRSKSVRWNAVECFAKVVPKMAEENLESARVVMRRFLWTLNDESGGIGWGAPESLAEIMVQHPQLRKEYLHMLISYMREDGEELFQDGNYLELPLLQRGLLWGVSRLCYACPDEMSSRGVFDDLMTYLDSVDEQVRGMALFAIGNLGERIKRDQLGNDIDVNFTLQLYWDGQFMSVSGESLLDRIGKTQGV